MKTLLLCTVFVALYLAGRIPVLERMKKAEERSAVLEQQRIDANSALDFWQELGLEFRDELTNSEFDLHDQFSQRFKGMGMGGSIVTHFHNWRVVPRFQRFMFVYSSDKSIYEKQLEQMGVRFVIFWEDPARIAQWVPGMNESEPYVSPTELQTSTVRRCADRDFELLPDSIVESRPKNMFKLLPRVINDVLAAKEREFLGFNGNGKRLEDVETTVFEIDPTGNSRDVTVKDQTYR